MLGLMAMVCSMGCGNQALELENQRLTQRIEALEARLDKVESSKLFQGAEDATRQQEEMERQQYSMVRPKPSNLSPECRETMFPDEYERLRQTGHPERIRISPECVITPVQAAVQSAARTQVKARTRGEYAQAVRILEWYMDSDGRDEPWATQAEKALADSIQQAFTVRDPNQNIHHSLVDMYQGNVPSYSVRCGKTACLVIGPKILVQVLSMSM